MTLKIPPPPDMGRDNQRLNRWLLEIQSILNSSGLIDPVSVEGLTALIAEVAANTASIVTLSGEVATLNTEVAANTANIATNTTNIATNTTNIATNTTAITALQGRNQILNGNGVPGAGLGSNGDLYINNTGGVGTHLYGKIGGAWIAFA